MSSERMELSISYQYGMNNPFAICAIISVKVVVVLRASMLAIGGSDV